MTLNLTIVNEWGIWQCSDHLLSDGTHSIKHAIIRCDDGVALLAYAGVGKEGLVHISDWIRETLRGQSLSLDQTFLLIRENATRDLAPQLRARGWYHMFSIGAFLAGRPWAVQIRNFLANNPLGPFGLVLDRFENVAKDMTGTGQGFMFGPPDSLTLPDLKLLSVIGTRKPRKPKDFRNLLAAMNRRASRTSVGKNKISAACVTTYIPPAGEPAEVEFHDAAGVPSRLSHRVVPTLLFGIDVSEMARVLPGRLQDDAFVEQAARTAVTTKNRLRR